MGLVIELKADKVSDYAAFSDSMYRFRSAIEEGGGRIVEIGVLDGWSYIDWLPVDADPDMQPIRAEFTLPPSDEILADLEESEIQVLPDREALFHGAKLTTCLVPGWAIPTPRDLLRDCAIADAGNCTSCPTLEAAAANKNDGTGSLVAFVGFRSTAALGVLMAAAIMVDALLGNSIGPAMIPIAKLLGT